MSRKPGQRDESHQEGGGGGQDEEFRRTSRFPRLKVRPPGARLGESGRLWGGQTRRQSRSCARGLCDALVAARYSRVWRFSHPLNEAASPAKRGAKGE